MSEKIIKLANGTRTLGEIANAANVSKKYVAHFLEKMGLSDRILVEPTGKTVTFGATPEELQFIEMVRKPAESRSSAIHRILRRAMRDHQPYQTAPITLPTSRVFLGDFRAMIADLEHIKRP